MPLQHHLLYEPPGGFRGSHLGAGRGQLLLLLVLVLVDLHLQRLGLVLNSSRIITSPAISVFVAWSLSACSGAALWPQTRPR